MMTNYNIIVIIIFYEKLNNNNNNSIQFNKLLLFEVYMIKFKYY
jgi:hypothetical protein